MTKRLTYTARQLTAALDSLAPAERRAAEALVARADDAAHLSVADIAAAAETSEATIVRMCKKAGFAGSNDVKLRLHRDLARRRNDATLANLDRVEEALRAKRLDA